MKRINILMGLLLILGTVACQNNAELEQRVTNLERRLVEVENKGVNTQPPVSMQTSNANMNQNPAVSGGPVFKFETTEFDFGRIKEGQVVNHTFEFTNVGDSPLIISNASASCGCTVPTYTNKPIPVGGKGKIEVQFNSQGKAFQQSPVVTVTANTSPSISRLLLKGYVDPNS